jgi:hypothetical protein
VAKARRKVVKNPMSSLKVACLSAVSASPVMISRSSDPTAACTAVASSSLVVEPSEATTMES